MKKIANLMWVSVIIWLIIIIMQLFIGIITIVFGGYGVATLLIMGWNIWGLVNYIKQINVIKGVDTRLGAEAVVIYFEKSITTSAIFAGINLVLGGVVGVIGCLYDLFLAIYVKKNKEKLLENYDY